MLANLSPSSACGNCLKYGAECPGYDKTRKFVAGKHAVRPRRARGALTTSQGDVDKGSGLLDLSSSSSDPATPPPFVPLTHQQALAKWSPSFRNYGGQEATASRQMGIPGSLKEQCVPFVYNMMGQLFTIHDRNEVVFIAPWFGTILNYLGKAPVLDSALCAYMLQVSRVLQYPGLSCVLSWDQSLSRAPSQNPSTLSQAAQGLFAAQVS